MHYHTVKNGEQFLVPANIIDKTRENTAADINMDIAVSPFYETCKRQSRYQLAGIDYRNTYKARSILQHLRDGIFFQKSL